MICLHSLSLSLASLSKADDSSNHGNCGGTAISEPAPESSGAGELRTVAFNNSMHSFNDERPQPPEMPPGLSETVALQTLLSELVLQLHHGTPWSLNPPQTFQLPWFPLL